MSEIRQRLGGLAQERFIAAREITVGKLAHTLELAPFCLRVAAFEAFPTACAQLKLSLISPLKREVRLSCIISLTDRICIGRKCSGAALRRSSSPSPSCPTMNLASPATPACAIAAPPTFARSRAEKSGRGVRCQRRRSRRHGRLRRRLPPRVFVGLPPDNGNVPLQVLVYVAAIESNVPLPNPEYKRLILEGARHWNISADYIAMLETIDRRIIQHNLVRHVRWTCHTPCDKLVANSSSRSLPWRQNLPICGRKRPPSLAIRGPARSPFGLPRSLSDSACSWDWPRRPYCAAKSPASCRINSTAPSPSSKLRSIPTRSPSRCAAS